MEEYRQITITEWWSIKEDIRRKLAETAENFVYIGCRLKEIEQSESYKQDGAADIYEFAEKEYGLHRSTTQRFMAINTKFSVGGNSTELLPEFKNFGSSKLQEMLTLSDDDCRLLTDKATVKEIRELKAFNKQQPVETEEEPAAEVEYTPLQKGIIDFFKKQEKREILNAVLKMYFDNEASEEITRQQVELINPSEFCTHIKGSIYLFMYELYKGVSYKTVGREATITKMEWVDFIEEIAKIYGASYGPDTWCNYYGPIVETVEPVKEERKETPKTPEKPQNTESESCATSHKKEQEEEEMEETEEEENETLEGETETEEEESETLEGENETEETLTETVYTTDDPAPEQNNDIVENPYYRLQEAAEKHSTELVRLIGLHHHVAIEPVMMRRIKAELSNLAAVLDQLEQMGEEE